MSAELRRVNEDAKRALYTRLNNKLKETIEKNNRQLLNKEIQDLTQLQNKLTFQTDSYKLQDASINQLNNNIKSTLEQIKEEENSKFQNNHNLNMKIVYQNKEINKELQDIHNEQVLLDRNKYLIKQNLEIIKQRSDRTYKMYTLINFLFYFFILVSIILLPFTVKNIIVKMNS